LDLSLHLTARCNLRCRYCYESTHQGGDMTVETARAAVDLGVDITQRETPAWPVEIVFFGGEPLLRRDLIAETVRYCRQVSRKTSRRFVFHMPTNGLLLDEAFLTGEDTREIQVALSIDGTPSAHDANRVDAVGRASFGTVARAAELLLRHQPDAQAQMVVTPFTARWLAASVKCLHSMGFRSIVSTLDHGAKWELRHFRTLEHQYELVADWYYQAYADGTAVRFSPFDHKIQSHIRPDRGHLAQCHLGQRQISVAPNGRLYPCVQFVDDGEGDAWAIGDVRTGLDEAARARLRDLSTEDPPECLECAIRPRCMHSCGCQNKQTTGRLERVSPIVCAHEQTVLPVADRVAERLYGERNGLFIATHYGGDTVQIDGAAPRLSSRKTR
jgi:uncharacterized protein